MTDRRPSTDERVDRYLTGSGAGTHLLGLGMDGLIARWEAIADEVAAGYRLGLDDYLNDLDLRQILAGAVAAVAETRGSGRPSPHLVVFPRAAAGVGGDGRGSRRPGHLRR